MDPKKEPEEQVGDQEQARRDNLAELLRQGVDLFPRKADWTQTVSAVVARYGNVPGPDLESGADEVRVPGRILSVRQMGKATFFHISDSAARLQVYIRADVMGPDNYKRFGLFDIGDIILAVGKLFKTRTGELTVLASEVVFLAKSLHPLPEKWHGLQDVELRYRKRYLDLIVNPETHRVFRLRSDVISAIRHFFDERGYVEVETPMMHAIPGGALARPFRTHHNALDMDLYLRVAPELYLKRLVVGGLERVYEINRNFRNEGISSEHNPEFTMLEFYEAYSDYHAMMELTEELLSQLSLKLLGKDEIPFGEQTIALKRPWRRIKYKDALVQYSGLPPAKLEDRAGLVAFAAKLAPDKTPLSYGKALDVLFDRFVKHNLVQPTFVVNPPREISPLAKASRDNPDEAERFELIVAGMEIANAFSELTDPAEQRARFEQQFEEKKRGDEEAHVIDDDYVQALEYGLPPTGGEGIGIDRLVMLLADKKSIREVILFPLLRPRE